MIDKEKLEHATYDAIYWWNRDESYFNRYFQRLDEISNDIELLHYFTSKIFDIFLRQYSVRRNISSDYKSVDLFLNDIKLIGFFDEVKKGNIDIIDYTSNKLIEIKSKSVNNKQTKSLLSKIAFLMNPNVFSLYDTLAKDTIYSINIKKVKRTDLENYASFLKNVNELKINTFTKENFKFSLDILSKFKGSNAYDFFVINEEAFKLRIIDKYLWLNATQNNESRKINHQKYIELYNL